MANGQRLFIGEYPINVEEMISRLQGAIIILEMVIRILERDPNTEVSELSNKRLLLNQQLQMKQWLLERSADYRDGHANCRLQQAPQSATSPFSGLP